LVLDTPSSSNASPSRAHQYWEFVADVTIRVDYRRSAANDYFTREVEIVKTRYQGHTLGPQVAKIFTKPKDILAVQNGVQTRDLADDPEGAKPHLYRGGLFVFPSLHYLLSKI